MKSICTLIAVLMVAVLMALVSIHAEDKTPPTFEQVNESPGDYKGQTLVFDKFKLSGDMENKERHYLLNVRTTAGKLIPASYQKNGLTFMASPNLASNLQKETEPAKESTVKLTCKIRPRGKEGKWFFAEVIQADFYGGDGKVRKSVDATPPGKEEDTKKDGITGRWGGPRKNDVQGDLGDDWLFVREFKDGKLVGEWWGMTIKDGVRVDEKLLTWEAEGAAKDESPIRYRVRCKVAEEGKVLLINYTLFYKESGKEKSYEGSSRLTKK